MDLNVCLKFITVIVLEVSKFGVKHRLWGRGDVTLAHGSNPRTAAQRTKPRFAAGRNAPARLRASPPQDAHTRPWKHPRDCSWQVPCRDYSAMVARAKNHVLRFQADNCVLNPSDACTTIAVWSIDNAAGKPNFG